MLDIITIDFWNTIFDSSGGDQRNTARRAALSNALDDAAIVCEAPVLEQAFTGIWGYFDRQWLEAQRTPTCDEMVREICRCAGVELSEELRNGVALAFERGVLDHPPQLLPGVEQGLEWLASRFRLAVISDTGFSPGSVLRELMQIRGIARYFDSFIFSDETGVAKPHPLPFRSALSALGGAPPGGAAHIGDIERTDIAGAQSVGMRAILYRGDHAPHKYVETETVADAVLEHWHDIRGVIEQLESPDGNRR